MGNGIVLGVTGVKMYIFPFRFQSSRIKMETSGKSKLRLLAMIQFLATKRFFAV